MTDVARLEIQVDSSGIRIARSELDRLGVSGKKAERDTVSASKRMRGGFDSLRASVLGLQAAFAALGAASVVREIGQSSIEMQRINNALKVATGSSQAAAKEFQFVSSEADRLGLNLRSAAKEYSSLAAAAKGTSAEGQVSRDIFIGISEAATALSLSAEQTGGALTAIQQIISKGSVQAEELRGQLGERLPGAFQIAARAMGKTTAELSKMLEKGEVTAEEFLPKFARELRRTFSGEAEDAADGLQQEINRLNTAFFNITSSGNVDDLAGSIGSLADTLNDPSIRDGLQTIVQGIINTTEEATRGIAKIGQFIDAVKRLDAGDAFRMATGPDDPLFGWMFEKDGGATGSWQSGASGSYGKSTLDPIDVTADRPKSSGSVGSPKRTEIQGRLQSLREEVALYGDLSRAEETRIALANGFYGQVSQAQAAQLMRYAEELDAKDKLATQQERMFERFEAGNQRDAELRDQQIEQVQRLTEELMTQEERATAALNSRLELINRNVTDEAQAAELRSRVWQRYVDDYEQGTNEMSAFAEQAARNIQDELGDTLRDTLSGDFDGILDSWTDMLLDMAAQAQAAQLGKLLLGDFGANGGKGEMGGLLGQAAGWIGGALAGGGGVSAASSGQSLADAGIGGAFGQFLGGRANGGPTASGGMYEINERGIPEVLTSGGRDYLMMGSQSGYVTPAQPTVAAPAANSGVVVNLNVSGVPAGYTAEQGETRDNGNGEFSVDMLLKRVNDDFVRDMAQRGTKSRAMQQTFSQLKRSGS